MSLTPGKPIGLSPKLLSADIAKNPTGASRTLTAISKAPSPGVSRDLPSGVSPPLSPSHLKNLSGSISKSPLRQTPTKSTNASFQSLSLNSSKAAVSLPTRSPSENNSPPSKSSNGGNQSNSLAVRPGFGQGGSKLVVDTNHFEMKLGNLQQIYLHSASVKADYERKVGNDEDGKYKELPVEVTPKKIRRVLTQLLEQVPSKFDHAATDYSGILVSATRLTPDKTAGIWNVEYFEIEEEMPAKSKRPFSVSLQHYKTVDVSAFSRYLISGGDAPSVEDKNDILNALNLILSRQSNQDAKTVVIGGTRHFARQGEANNFANLTQGLSAWFGYERSVRGSFKGLLLQVNCTASTFYATPKNGLTVDWLIDSWNSNEDQQNFNRKKLEKFLKGLRVTASYGRRLPYTVFGLSDPDTPGQRPTINNVSFTKKIYKSKTSGTKPQKDTYTEKSTTVREHIGSLKPTVKMSDYQTNYGLVINVGSKSRPICIPAELLRFHKGSPFRQLLDSIQTQKMVKYASKSARVTKDLIVEDGLKMFNIGDGQEQKFPQVAFSIGLKSTLPMQIKARVLGPPTLLYNSNKKRLNPGTKGCWLLKEIDIALHTVVRSPVWTIIEINDKNEDWCSVGARADFRKSLTINLKRYCSAPRVPAPIEITLVKSEYQIDPTSNAGIRTGLDGMLNDVQKSKGRKVSLIFVILPSKDAAMYDTLKHLAEVDYGIHTICTVKDGNGMNTRAEFFTNLMLKCNLKMGGTNTVLNLENDKEVQELLGSKPIMIVGADVTHAGVGSKMGTPSIVAVVASRGMMVEHLKQWAASTSNRQILPKRVIFYRDGVSEGEFNTVRTEEVSGIKRAFTRVYGKDVDHPKLLFLCVVKRSNAHFYPQGELKTANEEKGNATMDKNFNSWPGLVVDNDVTSQLYYDFYLQSHSSIKGTAKPAHYVVIVDEIGVTPDVLQRATYWQCYTFGRSMQAISAHPAARLADVACTRGRAYLRRFLDAANDNESDFGTNLTPAEKKIAREVKEAETYAAAISAWGRGVHADIAGSMHYI